MLNLLRRARPSSLRSLASKTTRFKDPNPPGPTSTRSGLAAAAGWWQRSSVAPAIASPCCGRWRRFYYAVRPELQHFRQRKAPRWYHNPRIVVTVVLAGGGLVVTIYYGNLEAVPYTNRSHFVLISPAVERQLGEAQFNQIKEPLRGKILPALHPDSIRIRLISKDIIGAVQRGLHHDERRWSDIDYASEQPSPEFAYSPDKTRDTFLSLTGSSGDLGKGDVAAHGSKEDEVLDDKWVYKSRKEAKARGKQPATKHLEGLNWEVLVVRDKMVNAMCLPGGKIIVFTGLLDHFRTDAEIATVIGHEVGLS
ncbi:hypothetical protein AXF42_Ash006217 [Apostasia shenzhenica]|uniref:Peptidase M48 domain-containing protein n=1 Tax=Apostasia shenzhenica TaxID=1088818 RepID=A0A2I0B0K3_9ASPA|nr:hypothetical protein AXF42_Ash006217 [Apostasia shenzhenica]